MDVAQTETMGAPALISAVESSSFRMPISEAPDSSTRAPGIRQCGSVVAHKYQLEALLGEGGMASVWSARNLQIDSLVALKLLRAGEQNGELKERLKIEARLSAQLEHPNIVRVFDAGETEQGEPFVVMEMLTGEPLSHLAARGRIPCVRTVQLMLPIAEALVLAHEKGIVHRDLKPDNVFLSTGAAGLQPKLLDFGIAKLSGPLSKSCQHITEAGTLLGSPDYMSPEQASGRVAIDHRSDIWSFCVVLYELIAQALPFRGGSNLSVLYSIVEHQPAPFETDAGVDDALAQIIYWGLQKEIDARPESMQKLGSALAGWLLQQGVLKDACGTSLEAKWNVPTEALSGVPQHPRSEHSPAQSSPGTLASQAGWSPTAKTVSLGPTARKRSIPWLLTALAIALALAGFWMSGNGEWSHTVRANDSPPSVEQLRPAPAPTLSAAHATPLITTVEALEQEPARTQQHTRLRAVRSPPGRAPTAASATSGSAPPAPSRPSAIDLMQPY